VLTIEEKLLNQDGLDYSLSILCRKKAQGWGAELHPLI
jgi:hypothetical protein